MREAAVIGKQHEIKGQTICAFVSLKAGIQNSPPLVDELKGHVAKKIGPIAGPDEILFAAGYAQDALGENHAPRACLDLQSSQCGRRDDASEP